MRDGKSVEIYGLHSYDSSVDSVAYRDVKLVNFLRIFFTETGLQGIPHLVRQRGILRKFFWMCCIGAAAYGLYWELDSFFQNYLKWTPATKISLEMRRSIDFPAVSVCNSNGINKEWFDSHKTTYQGAYEGVTFDSSRKKRSVGQRRRRRSSETTTRSTIGSDTWYTDTSSTASTLSSLQTAMSMVHLYTNSTTRSDAGNCWTFNIGSDISSSIASAKELYSARGDSSLGVGIFKSSQIGKEYGLHLLLNTDLSRYLETSVSHGWRILVHNQSVYPFPEAEGVLVQPGTSTQIQVKQSYLKKLSTVNNGLYTETYSDCVDAKYWEPNSVDNAYGYSYPAIYTKETCYRTCYQLDVIQECGCYDYSAPYEGPAFSAYSDISVCASDNETQWSCKLEKYYSFSEGKLNCSNCKDSCLQYSYDMSISSEKFPVPTTANLATSCKTIETILNNLVNGNSTDCTGKSNMKNAYQTHGYLAEMAELNNYCYTTTSDLVDSANKGIGKRFAEVFIYYKTFDVQSIVESESYALADVIAYLGGIVGLFFGFTIITIVEYVLLFFDIIIIACAKLCCQRRHPKPASVGPMPNNKTDPWQPKPGLSTQPSFAPLQPVRSTGDLGAATQPNPWANLYGNIPAPPV